MIPPLRGISLFRMREWHHMRGTVRSRDQSERKASMHMILLVYMSIDRCAPYVCTVSTFTSVSLSQSQSVGSERKGDGQS